jgi:hypothetical protein
MKTRQRKSLWLLWPALFGLFAFAVFGRQLISASAEADDSTVPKVLLGEVQHETVSKLGPRNRTDVGIGEDVRLWVDSFGEGVSKADLTGEINWNVTGGGTVYPLLGDSTMLNVSLSDRDGQLNIHVLYRPLPADSRIADQVAIPYPDVPQGPLDDRPVEERQADAEWLTRLSDLRRMMNGHETNLPAVEQQARELLDGHFVPANRALVQFELATIHAQSGLQQPGRVIDLAQKALGLPLDRSRRLRLQAYWGDALRVLTGNHSFPQRRKAAATVYLQGLKETVRYELPDKPPELPAASFAFGAAEGFDDAKYQRQRQREVHHREWIRVRHIREMVNHREVLKRQIVSVYRRKPFDLRELKLLANEILQDKAETRRLADSVAAAQVGRD